MKYAIYMPKQIVRFQSCGDLKLPMLKVLTIEFQHTARRDFACHSHSGLKLFVSHEITEYYSLRVLQSFTLTFHFW